MSDSTIWRRQRPFSSYVFYNYLVYYMMLVMFVASITHIFVVGVVRTCWFNTWTRRSDFLNLQFVMNLDCASFTRSPCVHVGNHDTATSDVLKGFVCSNRYIDVVYRRNVCSLCVYSYSISAAILNNFPLFNTINHTPCDLVQYPPQYSPLAYNPKASVPSSHRNIWSHTHQIHFRDSMSSSSQ